MAYAEIGDLEARWRPLSDDEKTRAGTLLDDAAVIIDTACPPASPLTDAAARKMVSCSIVKRAMSAPAGVDGAVTSVQQGAGPYQQTTQYANPNGDLYLTKADRRLLGCGRQEAFTIRPDGSIG